jgi:hypothetical protein
MSVCSNFLKPDAIREESLKLFISAIQAAPEAVPKNLSSGDFAKYLTEGADLLAEYISPGKTT